MRRHAVERHGAPRVIFWRRLREPDIAGIAREPAGLQGTHDGIAFDELATCGVDEIRAALHQREHPVVEEVLC